MKPRNFVMAIAALLISVFISSPALLSQELRREAPQDAGPFMVYSDLISLNVTVTDRKGEAITGLERGDFKVYENGVEQPLDFFSREEMPVCWGIVLDSSTSMSEEIDDVYQAAVDAVSEGTEKDQTFIVTFNKRVELAADFISDKDLLKNSILGLRAEGQTALWDAISFALDHLKQDVYRKKVLIVITDGKDNVSRTKFRDLMTRAREEDVLIYPVAMLESDEVLRPGTRNSYFSMRASDNRKKLERLASVTGAYARFTTNTDESRAAMRAIAGELGHQYRLRYYTNSPKRDGRWRKIRVVVSRGQGKARYVTRTRTGYYAPKAEKKIRE